MNDDKEDLYKVDDEEENDDKKSSSSGGFVNDELKAKLIKYGIIIFVGLIVLLILIALFFPKGSKSSGGSSSAAKEITLTSGEKYTLEYSTGSYTWTSSNQSVAKVSNDGEIIGVKKGDATITLKVGKETVEYKVHVDNVDDSVVVTRVKMEKNTIELEENKEYEMEVEITPNNAKNVELTWTSSNEEVATVKDGVIKAIAPGTSIITVKSTNGNTDNCVVKVKGDGNYNPIEKIEITSSDVSLNKGTSYALSYDVVPEESVNLITWESTDPEIATVENGVIYALKSGEVEIFAKSVDIFESIKVTVIEEKVEPKFIINQTSIGLNIGEDYTLSINNDTKVSWSSENTGIATVDSTGKVVGKAEGETVIYATDKDGNVADCKVTVTNKDEQQSDVITLNTHTLAMNVGDTNQLVETVTPSNNVSNVTWSSSDTKVATVNKGTVNAVGNGTATITAKLPNGSTAECVVNVSTKVVKPALVTLNANALSLAVNGTTQLTATVMPSNTTNKEVTWSSSNPDVATVDKNGKVTAKKKGTTKIYAKASNGVFGVCGITVK